MPRLRSEHDRREDCGVTMKQIHLVTRTDIDYMAIAFVEKNDAEQWIIDNVVPNFRNIWRAAPIEVFESMAEYKGDRKL
jgi:hypothetical protein